MMAIRLHLDGIPPNAHVVVAAREPIADLIARSSIGAALADIKERGIDAHIADLSAYRAAKGSK